MDKIKLNHNCFKCKKRIYISDYVFTKNGAYHITCLLQEEREKLGEQLKEMLKEKKSWVGNELFEDIDKIVGEKTK